MAAGEVAPAIWGIPVVSGSSERAALFPVPATNQRVYNLTTRAVERYNGSAWVEDISGAAFNVKMFGAVCDGATDDTAAIQLAIDALGDTSTMRYGRLFFPGLSVISGTLTFDRKAIEICGFGKGSGLVWNGADNIPMVKFKRVWMVSVHHLRFLNKHATNKPSACIEVNVTTGDSPSPTRLSFRHLTIGGDGFNTSTQKQFRAGIITSGDNLQCDQSEIDDLSLSDCTDYGIRLEDSQNVFWKISNSSINAGLTAKGISTAARYTTLDTVFFQTNGVDIELVGDAAVEGTNLGSEISGKFVLATTAGNFTCKGGYFQYNSVNQNADGKIIDMQGGVLLQLEHFRFTDNTAVSLTQKIWLRGQDVTARFLDMDPVGASWTAFLDVATTGATQTRHVEVLGKNAFRNAWTHGDTFTTVDPLRYDLSPNQFVKQEDFQSPALQNSWANFGGGWSTWGIYKDKDGRVWLRGAISGGTTTDGTLLATLPVGYRPGFLTPVIAYANASATPQRFRIATNGQITLDGAAGGMIALDGISFRAA